MKNSTLLASVVLAMGGVAFQANAVNGPTDIYDLSPWDNDQVLKLFSTAFDKGQNYPSKEDLREIGITMDLEFVRSHTRYRKIVKDESKDIISDINHDRQLWCNFPGGYGKNTGGYPSTTFDQDVFSLWNYTSIWGSWGTGFNLAPGAWVDAAHRNGTRIYGGIKFFEGWNDDGSEATFNQFISTKADPGNPDGYTYKYSRAFVNAAAFFGNDGYNYNSEGDSYRFDDWVNFHKEVRQIARKLNIEGFGIGQYTQQYQLGTSQYAGSYFGTIYADKDGVIFDCMLNYSGGNFANPSSTINVINENNLTFDNIFQGVWIVGLDRYWTMMNTTANRVMNMVLWGEHDQSRFFQFRIGNSPTNTQENYQLLLEKAFSGANRNPLKTPKISDKWGDFQVSSFDQAGSQLNNAPGFSSMLPERTAIDGKLPFQTNFTLGNGENYFYKGKITHGSWYNMSQQDIVPTYRWLITPVGNMTQAADDIDVRFTHEDAYIGGSSLRLQGYSKSTGNDVILYRTKLEVSEANPKVTVALKGQVGDPNLSVIVKTAGGWQETALGALQTTAWEEQTVALNGVNKSDVIEYIGLRAKNITPDTKILVGQLKLSDDRTVQHADIDKESVMVEIKRETKTNLTVKLGYEPDYSSFSTSVEDYGMVYNDEINVDHFEIFVKDSKEGKPLEVARTSQWAAFVGDIPLEQDQQDAWVGVRSVSVDLKTVSPVYWIQIPRSEGDLPDPAPVNDYGQTYMSSTGNANEQISGAGSAAYQGDPEGWCTHEIYVEKVKTSGAVKDLDYYVTKNPCEGETTTQYYFAEDHKLIVKQGQTVTVQFKGYDNAVAKGGSGSGCSLRYDFIYGYLDLDGNHSFLDGEEKTITIPGAGTNGGTKVVKDETIFFIGTGNSATNTITDPGVTFEFTVPENAKVGESCLRFVCSDAWSAHPGPIGGTTKGYSIDFPVEIQKGDNDLPEREPAPTYKEFRDQGEAESPADIEDVHIGDEDTTGVDNVFESDGTFSSVVLDEDMAIFANTDEAWFYTIDGKAAKHVANAKAPVSVAELPAGIYVVKMLNGRIVRSAKVVKK